MKATKWLKSVLAGFALLSAPSFAEDIDLFAGVPVDGTDALPTVIFVLDNTSNWTAQNQRWPDGNNMGESELRAIKLALSNVINKVNVGLFTFSNDGSANLNGGQVRYDVRTLTDDVYTDFSNVLDNIDPNAPAEKRNSNTEFGNLLYDVYNYLGGDTQSFGGDGTLLGTADATGYSTYDSVFDSPLTSDNACGNVYVVFVGNPNSSGPADDDATNSAALTALYEEASATPPDALADSASGVPIPLPEITTSVIDGDITILGLSASKHREGAVDQCTRVENGSRGACEGQTNCSCIADTEQACESGSNPDCSFEVGIAGESSTVITPTGNEDTESGRDWNLDDWAKFLLNYGPKYTVNVDGVDMEQRVSVVTYTVDVFNAQPNSDHTSLLVSTADAGGGSYFAATNEDDIINAFDSILSDIISVTSSFAAVTLPVNAGERTQSANQVYVGSFRPALDKTPRWFGNLKRYQLGLFNGAVELADVDYRLAINPLTGAPAECATSWWSTDSGNYWEELGYAPAPRGSCLADDVLTSDWSDAPDGPFTSKGGAAQMVRGNGTRTLYTVGTVSGVDTLRAMTSASDAAAMGGADIYSYFLGTSAGIDETLPDTGLRASLHGGVVHSRPLVVNYGSSIKIFYGANDGLFRATDSVTGQEDWALMAPGHMDRVERLHDNAPKILYGGFPGDVGDANYEPKDYFFDGASGQYVTYDDDDVVSEALIFPSMRRGGREIYALDVSDPAAAPSLLWVLGCADDTTSACSSADFTDIGDTWSTPQALIIEGYDEAPPVDDLDAAVDPIPVVVFGGGYDECLDVDVAANGCDSSANGRSIYIVNARSGAVLKKFAVDAPVVAEPAPLDSDFDGKADLVYVVDAAGGLYRITLDATPANSTILKVAAPSAGDADERRFFSRPEPFKVPQTNFVAVAITSGDREKPLVENYPYEDSVQNKLYMFFDRPSGFGAATLPINLDSLLALTGSAPTTEQITTANGWLFSVPDRGEQIVNPAAIGGGRVFFNSYQPGGEDRGLCSPPLGIATAYDIPIFSPVISDGTELPGGGMPIPPVIATVSIDPPGYNPDCVPSETNVCEEPVTRTVCIGCTGFDVIELDPSVDQTRQRVWWIEDMDR
ncbi:pilus assembly protein [Congregibacter sp.]|uniref:pilus assembly protein n=1 Tax=Congregibacter sp. TaxID=2744308 RepID=UPI003F6B866F